MSINLYLAPAASGKTSYVIDVARNATKNYQAEARVLVATDAQKYALRRRLAEAGGALGIRLMTFDDIYSECLSEAGESYLRLTEPIKHQIIKTVLGKRHLEHYHPLIDKPGFVKELVRIIDDLKATKIWPHEFLAAVEESGKVTRLFELGSIYNAYQDLLRQQEWADRPGRGWLAVEALEDRAPDVASDWPLLLVDGFDSFTKVQLAMLKILSVRVHDTIVTLTKASSPEGRDDFQPFFRRFQDTRSGLEETLGIIAEPFPDGISSSLTPIPARSQDLVHLEANLFTGQPSQMDDSEAIALIAAPDRAAEVRCALRWLKERVVRDEIPLGEVALLARDLGPYRSFIIHTAAEFRLPLRLIGGLPLSSNPAIVAVLDLLKLVMPPDDQHSGPALSRQGVVDAWRSPYFDWKNAYASSDAQEPIGITPADADALDAAARKSRVIGGLDQWNEFFTSTIGRTLEVSDNHKPQSSLSVDATDTAKTLFDRFSGFWKLMEPPKGQHTFREFVRWLDALLGPDPDVPPEDRPVTDKVFLRVKDPERDVIEPVALEDVKALRKLKEVLRSLVWVEEALGPAQRADYGRFITVLSGMIEATTYDPVIDPGIEKIMVADVIAARGVPFQAVAILGLAEGEFPRTTVEDPFLWETDRTRLRDDHKIPLESSIESYEQEYFYEAVTRPRKKLLLTRPRLADSGAEWQPSPFWEEIHRLVNAQPVKLTTESVPVPQGAASWSELMDSLVYYPDSPLAIRHVQKFQDGRWASLERSSRVFTLRYSRDRTPFNGDLTGHARPFARHFHAGYYWSPSSLESYHSCPFSFFVGRVLKLEPRLEPAEGLDSAQLGTIYHRILEALYQALSPSDRTDPEKLLSLLRVTARRILDEAPHREGFRETAWWKLTREEIAQNVERSLIALAELDGNFVPVRFELRFFGANSLTVREGSDLFRLTGVIDRIDQDPEGRLRIIDYKSASPYSYTKKTLENGEKIQLPLYALAARDALKLGEPVEGIYWHIRQAVPSDISLGSYGPSEAIDIALGFAWQSVRGARLGYFVPEPPPNGCPDYCPAVAFCWRYRPGMWG